MFFCQEEHSVGPDSGMLEIEDWEFVHMALNDRIDSTFHLIARTLRCKAKIATLCCDEQMSECDIK